MAEEIKQRITVDASDAVKNLEAVAAAEKKMVAQTDKAGQSADRSATKTRSRAEKTTSLKNQLMQLIREDERATLAAQRSGQVDERAARATDQRRQRIDRIARALATCFCLS